MIVMPDRWSCPGCPITVVRAAGVTDASWRRRLHRAQRKHGARHAAQLAENIRKATTNLGTR